MVCEGIGAVTIVVTSVKCESLCDLRLVGEDGIGCLASESSVSSGEESRRQEKLIQVSMKLMKVPSDALLRIKH